MIRYRLSEDAKMDLARIYWRGVDSIYYRVNGQMVEIMRVLGRQDVYERL